MVKEGGRVGCDNNVNKLEYEGRVVRDNSEHPQPRNQGFDNQ